MDQTINEMLYSGRINSTVRAWNEQANGNLTGGTVIGSDGTTFKKVGNKLVQVLDPKMLKRVARLEKKLTADGLVKSTSVVTEESVAATSNELIAEL